MKRLAALLLLWVAVPAMAAPRVYLADVSRAKDDVSRRASLPDVAERPIDKCLLLNFDQLEIRIDNLEAMAWGPRQKDSARTLVLASEDNDDASQANQILVLRVAP